MRGGDLHEDFSGDPQSDGWNIFGNTNLFQWDTANQNLDVTWDSSQTNSYFYHSLGTIVAKSDNFGISFDLQLSNIVIGVNPVKPATFEVAVGFINLVSATSTNLERGTGINAVHGARNLCEFDYFPDSGYGATISPTLISSNNQYASVFAHPYTLDPGALFHVTMTYIASNQTLQTFVTRNGIAFDSTNTVLGASFSDFRLDQVAISSYSDAGADGSLLATAPWIISSSPSRHRRCKISPAASPTASGRPNASARATGFTPCNVRQIFNRGQMFRPPRPAMRQIYFCRISIRREPRRFIESAPKDHEQNCQASKVECRAPEFGGALELLLPTFTSPSLNCLHAD